MTEPRRPSWLGPAVALLVALYARLAVLPARLGEDGVLFPGPDSYYHARRVLYALSHGAQLIAHDTGLAAVEPPMRCPWPPLFDGALTLLGLLFRPLLGENRYLTEVLLSLAPPLLGVLTVAALYRLAKRPFGQRGATIAAFLLACMPVHINMTMFGALDHHSVEALVVVGLVLLEQGEPSRLRRVAAGVLAGACVGLAQVFWLYAMIYAAYLTYRAWRGSGVLPQSSAMVGVATVVALVQLARGYPGIAYETASLLHPLLLAVPLVYAIADRGCAEWPRQRALQRYGAVLATVIFLVAIGLAEPVARQLVSGAGFARRGNVVALIAESRPIFEASALELGYLGYGIYLWPLLLLAAMWTWRRCGRGEVVLSLGLALALSLLTLQQLRFATALSPLVALVTAFWIDRALSRFRLPPWGAAAVVAGVVVGSFFPYLRELTLDLRLAPQRAVLEQERLYRWLRQATPKQGSAADPQARPAYRVMANWAAGHALLHRADRAVVANPYIFDVDSPGFAESIRFHYVWTEEEAHAYARRARVRYAVVAPELNAVGDELAALGLPVGEYVAIDSGATTVRKRLTRSFAFRRGFLRPDRSGSIPGSSRFALRYETPLVQSELGHRDSATKIRNEIVSGAEVTGEVSPREPVEIRLALRTPAGRTVPFVWRATADRAGRFWARLPYETAGAVHGGTEPDPRGYELLTAQGLQLRFHLSRTTVERGETVRVVESAEG